MNRVGVWNVRGIGEDEKREEVVNVFKEGRFDMLALNETKLRGKGEFEWGGVKGVRSGVDAGRAKEGVAMMMNDVWFEAVVGYGCVSSRMLWVKFKFARVKLCVVAVYGPCNDRKECEKDKFWNDLRNVMNKVGNGYRLLVVGDLNGWVGDEAIDGITGKFGVPGVNENGERVVDFCADRGMCIANTHFRHKDIHKYTWRGKRGGTECRSLIDLVLVKKDMLSPKTPGVHAVGMLQHNAVQIGRTYPASRKGGPIPSFFRRLARKTRTPGRETSCSCPGTSR